MRPPLALTVIPVRSQWSCYNFARWYKPPKVSKKSHPKVDSMPRLDEDSSDAKQWDAPLEVPAMALSKIGWVDTPASWQFHGKMIIMLVQKKGPPSSIEKSWVGLKPSIYMDSLWHCFTNCRFFNYPNLRPIMYDQKHQQLLQKWQPPYYFSNYIMACFRQALIVIWYWRGVQTIRLCWDKAAGNRDHGFSWCAASFFGHHETNHSTTIEPFSNEFMTTRKDKQKHSVLLLYADFQELIGETQPLFKV